MKHYFIPDKTRLPYFPSFIEVTVTCDRCGHKISLNGNSKYQTCEEYEIGRILDE